jgi:hypothetical protein
MVWHPGALERAPTPASRVAAPQFCWARTLRPAVVRWSVLHGPSMPTAFLPHSARATHPRTPRRPPNRNAAVPAPCRPANCASSYACTAYVPIPLPTVDCVRAKSSSAAIRSPKLPARARLPLLALSAIAAIGALGELHPPAVLLPNLYCPYLHQDSL